MCGWRRGDGISYINNIEGFGYKDVSSRRRYFVFVNFFLEFFYLSRKGVFVSDFLILGVGWGSRRELVGLLSILG